MALKAGRVGVAKDQVDEFGHITGGGTPENVYTKSQCDNKFELKSHIGGLKFRDNDGTAQYQLPNGEWTNFSSGGSVPTLLWTNPDVTLTQYPNLLGYADCVGFNSQPVTLSDFDVDDYEYYIFFNIYCAVESRSVIKGYEIYSTQTLKNCNNNIWLHNPAWSNVASRSNLRVENDHIVIPAGNGGNTGVYKVWGINGLDLDSLLIPVV